MSAGWALTALCDDLRGQVRYREPEGCGPKHPARYCPVKWPRINWIETQVVNWNEDGDRKDGYSLDEPQVLHADSAIRLHYAICMRRAGFVGYPPAPHAGSRYCAGNPVHKQAGDLFICGRG